MSCDWILQKDGHFRDDVLEVRKRDRKGNTLGNLITNIIKFTGKPDSLKTALVSALGDAASGVDITKVATDWRDDLRLPFSLSTLVPEPAVVAATSLFSQSEDIGLAILSVGGVDWLRFKTEKDAFLNSMPPEYTETSAGLLAKLKLDGLTGKALHDKAAIVCPDAIPAGRAARESFKKTGHFNWQAWRAANWGTQAGPEEATVRVEDVDCVSIRFDTVNTAPNQWFMAFAKANPDVMCEGAGYDEDTDYAVRFVGDEPGEILIEDGDDADAVAFARMVVHGPRPDEDLDDGLSM